MNLFEQEIINEAKKYNLSVKVRNYLLNPNNWEVNNYDAFLKNYEQTPSDMKAFMTYHGLDELKTPEWKTFNLKNHPIGFALHYEERGKVDICNVYNNSDLKNVAKYLLKFAKSQGGTKLDNYAGYLSKLYQRSGFDKTEEFEWDEKYRPDDWNEDKFGTPNVELRSRSSHDKKHQNNEKYKSQFDNKMDNAFQGHSITEDRLREIIKEVIINEISKRINEDSISQKKRDMKNFEKSFRGGKSFGGIKTMAIFTSENPNSQRDSSSNNKKSIKNLLSDLKTGGFKYVPAYGKFGFRREGGVTKVNSEHSYVVFNISVANCVGLCKRYNQTSFIFCTLNDEGKIHSEYYEKTDDGNTYQLIDSEDNWNDKTGENDYYTVVGKNFKFAIPFSVFENVNNNILGCLDYIIEKYKNNSTRNELLEYSIHGHGQNAYLVRKSINNW